MLTVDNTYDVDWDKINEAANKELPTGAYGRKSTAENIWLKLTPGIHTLRIVPSGNQTEKLPYLQTSEHKYSGVDETGRRVFGTITCWRYLYDNLMSKKTPEEQKQNSLISYLGANNMLDQENYRKYKEFGCPWCTAHAFLTMHGVDKDVRKNLWPVTTYYWNVLHRRAKNTGDDRVYIWRQSNTQFKGIINTLRVVKETGNDNYLHVETGRDLMIQAEGVGLARRYPLIQFMGYPSTLNLGDQTPHHLEAKVLAAGWRTYQDSVNLLKQYHGDLLSKYGHIIQGDVIISKQYQHVGTMLADIAQPIQEIAKESIPIQQATTVGGIKPFSEGDEIVVVNGKLINKKTGQEVF